MGMRDLRFVGSGGTCAEVEASVTVFCFSAVGYWILVRRLSRSGGGDVSYNNPFVVCNLCATSTYVRTYVHTYIRTYRVVPCASSSLTLVLVSSVVRSARPFVVFPKRCERRMLVDVSTGTRF